MSKFTWFTYLEMLRLSRELFYVKCLECYLAHSNSVVLLAMFVVMSEKDSEGPTHYILPPRTPFHHHTQVKTGLALKPNLLFTLSSQDMIK